MEQERFKTAKLESIGGLAGGIAHDFNNLLNAVLGNTSLLKMEGGLRGKPLERLDRMEKSIYRARELTQQLLTFAKGGDPIRKTVRINDLIVDNARFVLSGSKARSEFDIAGNLWPVEADLGQLSQVINNLIINAAQAMPEGGTVRITARNLLVDALSDLPLAPGRYIAVSVQDDGVGIPADSLERIFDPYHTTKEQGSGLGLATSHSIITKHKGCITVSSEVGRGSTFTIHLPATLSSCPSDQRPETDVPLPQVHGRILILDDEESILELTCELLELMGFEAVGVKDGQEAVERYTSAMHAGMPYDLLILDLTVPGGMGGKKVIGILKDIDPQVKAIVSSGYSQDPIMARHAEYGFCDVLAKPYRLDDLKKTVLRVLRGDP